MELPISRKQAVQASRWLKDNFGTKINAAVQGTAFTIDHVCGIACQETAYRWLGWLDDGLSIGDILGACVLDGSGDVKDSTRSAFPKNTAAFRARYGDTFTNLLIAEGNKMRRLMGWGPVNWIYKGYGIFQYDLQFVKEDEAYFRERKWHDFDVCLRMLMGELKTTWAWVQVNHSGKSKAERIRLAIRKYNGAGPRAEAYSHNVIFFTEAAAEAAGPGGPGDAPTPALSIAAPKITGIDFEMELGSGDSLRFGNLVCTGKTGPFCCSPMPRAACWGIRMRAICGR